MVEQSERGPDDLRKLRPQVYLQAGGCLDEAGQPRQDLAGDFATAACLAYEDGQTSPQELSVVYEAIRQCLEMADQDSTPSERFQQTVNEAFELTTGMLRKEVNPAIAAWVREWIPFVDSEAAIEAFLQHLNSVSQQYSLIIGIKA